MRGGCSLFENVKTILISVQSPATCPWAEACQHCQVSRWKGKQLNCCLLLSFASHLSLKFRHCGALEQCGQSPTMPTTTLAAGTITIYISCSTVNMLYIEENPTIDRRINLLPMTRAHHGGWKMHTSKPPTMPDNSSYPKKV